MWVPFSACKASRGTYARRLFTPRTGRHRQFSKFDLDFRLVGRRNTIAHGEAFVPDLNECIEVRNVVLELLDAVKDSIVDFATSKSYLRPAPAQGAVPQAVR